MQKYLYVYIITNKRNGTLYTGITSNLSQRISQHKNKEVDGFSRKYNLDKLIYYEQFEQAEPAIIREKQLKKWKRSWKLRIIEAQNPAWNDLFDNL